VKRKSLLKKNQLKALKKLRDCFIFYFKNDRDM
jgi:hypothetical protein